MHLLWELYPGNRPTHSERYLIVQEYLQLGRKLEKERSKIENRLLTDSLTEPATITKIVDADLSGLVYQKKILLMMIFLMMMMMMMYIDHHQVYFLGFYPPP